jgi:hypothetical protein
MRLLRWARGSGKVAILLIFRHSRSRSWTLGCPLFLQVLDSLCSIAYFGNSLLALFSCRNHVSRPYIERPVTPWKNPPSYADSPFPAIKNRPLTHMRLRGLVLNSRPSVPNKKVVRKHQDWDETYISRRQVFNLRATAPSQMNQFRDFVCSGNLAAHPIQLTKWNLLECRHSR